MAIMKTVNEKSSCTIEVTFRDEDEELVVPDSISYRIDDVASGTEILDDTDVTTPATTIEIEITSEQNELLDEDNDNEVRVLTVEFDYDSERKHGTSEYKYKILNLLKVDSGS